MPFDLRISKPTGLDAKKAAIEAAKAKALPTGEAVAMVKYIQPSECTDHIGIIFDDSGSMGIQVEHAKTGVVEFLKNCIPNQTAVGMFYMNSTAYNTGLRSNLPELARDIQECPLRSGGTPFFNTLRKALESKDNLTRLVAFTDGSPTDTLHTESNEIDNYYEASEIDNWLRNADVIIKIATSKNPPVPIDTVFFGQASYSNSEIKLLKYLSEKTGGFFLHFDPSKSNIWKQLKYLAPVNRLALTDGSFRAKVERGE